MGIGDNRDSTTDFFDSHKAQCTYYRAKLLPLTGTSTLRAEMASSITLCNTAISGGRRRAAMAAALASLPAIVAAYEALPQATKDAFLAAIAADPP